MALDIHRYEDGQMGELLFQIDDRAYAALHPAFELFRQRTGQFIDPYGDLVVDGNMSILMKAIADASENLALLAILEDCAAKGTAIIFAGD